MSSASSSLSFVRTPRSPFSPGQQSTSASHNKRQLIRPNSHIPWSVDVVSAVPGPVVEVLGTALSGATHNKWSCLVFPGGIVYVWQSKQTTNLGEPLQRPREFAKLYLPDLRGNDDREDPVAPLVALASPHGGDDRDAIHLYVLHPTTGWLVLRKVTRRDMRSTLGTHTARIRIPIGDDDDDDNEDGDGDGENDRMRMLPPPRFTALACHNSMVVAGTSSGDLYWITHIAVPVGLHLQKVEAPDTSSFFSRLIFGGGSAGAGVGASAASDRTLVTGNDAAATVVPLGGDNNEFLAISVGSGVVKWTAEQPIASGHHAVFSPVPLGTFAEFLEASSSSSSNWTVRELLRAVVSADSRVLHCIVRGKLVASGESRLYWIVAKLSNEGVTIVRSHWLSRFALPDQVRVLGLVSCENGSVYASVSTPHDAVIVMALVPGGGGGDDSDGNGDGDGDGNDDHVLQEVDLPTAEIPDLMPGMMERDTISHGCYMVASSGIGMRVRCMHQQPPQQGGQSPSKRRKLGNDKILAQHLRSHFWASYQDPNAEKPTPPSLLQADPADLESAAIQVGAELQQKGDPSSYSISLEWHSSFVNLLQNDGLYRHLSEDGKWNLLGIGQELRTFGTVAELLLHKYKHTRDQDLVESWRSGLQSQAMAEWFLSVQQMVEDSGWLHAEAWYDLLGAALESILGFREDFAETVYDVASEKCSEPLWTSHPSMKEMLNRQIKYWEKNYQNVPLPLVEAAVKTALLSHSESIVPSQQSTEEANRCRIEFVRVQKAALSLLRKVGDGNDELAFELCVQYRYFDGLCELSIAHEKLRDASSYALDPLFDTMTGTDSRSGWSFPQHVLQWHTDKGLYGQVINYGRHSIADLNRIMEKNPQLRQHRWIPTVRQGYYAQATNLFLENCKEHHGLSSHKWALSMAKLTNKLVPAQSQQAQDQGRKIERALDLVDAQQLLLSPSEQEHDCPILPPNELVELAIRKLEESHNEDDRVRLAFVGLTVCNFLDDTRAAALEQTSRIWAEALLADGGRWSGWAVDGGSFDPEGLRADALASTVFGRVLNECRKDPCMKDVTYGRHIEKDVIDRVQGDENREAFTRVLRTVADAAPAESIRVDSLLVSTY